MALDEETHHGVVMFEDGPLTFPKWMAKVNAAVVKISGLDAEDFADWDYSSAFEDAVEPRQAAIDMLAEDVTGRQILEFKGLMDEVSY